MSYKFLLFFSCFVLGGSINISAYTTEIYNNTRHDLQVDMLNLVVCKDKSINNVVKAHGGKGEWKHGGCLIVGVVVRYYENGRWIYIDCNWKGGFTGAVIVFYHDDSGRIVYDKVNKFKKFFIDIGKGIERAVTTVVEKVKGFTSDVKAKIKGVASGLSKGADELEKAGATTLPEIPKSLTDMVAQLQGQIPEIDKGIGLIDKGLKKIDASEAKIVEAKSQVPDIVEKIEKAIKELKEALGKIKVELLSMKNDIKEVPSNPIFGTVTTEVRDISGRLTGRDVDGRLTGKLSLPARMAAVAKLLDKESK